MTRTTIQPWTAEEAKQHRAMARQAFKHDHEEPIVENWDGEEQLTRENCGACALEGFEPLPGTEDDQDAPPEPNHADWTRIYVEAGRPIPEVCRTAFEDKRANAHGNARHAAALARSIVTFGVEFTP